MWSQPMVAATGKVRWRPVSDTVVRHTHGHPAHGKEQSEVTVSVGCSFGWRDGQAVCCHGEEGAAAVLSNS